MKPKLRIAIIATVLYLLPVNLVFGAINYERYNDCIFDTVDYDSNSSIENADVEKVIKDTVPEDCRKAFMYYTEGIDKFETINLRIQLLAMGQWESGWKVTISNTVNKNGTVDLGYLALNSANAESEWFMSRFGPNEEDGFNYDKNNDNERYLIACIKFYKSLYNVYGEDAAYCYNAGVTRYTNHNIPSSTYTYKKRVSEYIEKFIQDAKMYAVARIEFEKMLDRCCHYNLIILSNVCKRNYFKNIVHNMDKQFSSNFAFDQVCLNSTDQDYLLSDKNRRMIDDALSTGVIPNSEYVCIGYIRKYGNHLAPVFKSTITGERIIC